MDKIHVVFQFDTEDFITPEADDVLLELTRIMTEHGTKGSFCIVGEKARAIERRGRTDIIEAIGEHDIAYQSDLHSVHPVISEYLAEEDWSKGVEEFIRSESSGVNDLVRVFGLEPSAFIQPGGSWAPEAPYAAARLGIPVYADGIFESEPFWFCGALCLKASMHFPEHSTIGDLPSLKGRFRDHLRSIDDARQGKAGLIVIFSHPCMFVTETFWDSVNFSNGRIPPREGYVTPPLRPKKAYKEALMVFEEFLECILEFRHVRIVTFRDVAKVYSEPEERVMRLDQIFSMAREAVGRNDWQIVDKISVSPAETLRLFVDLVSDCLAIGIEPNLLPVYLTLGPTAKPYGSSVRRTVGLKDLLSLCRKAKEYMEEHNELPTVLSSDNIDYGPSDLLEATARAVAYYSKFRCLPDSVEIGNISELPDVVRRWNLKDRVKSQWRWPIFRSGFDSRKIEDLTLWQSWTIRPAVFSAQSELSP